MVIESLVNLSMKFSVSFVFRESYVQQHLFLIVSQVM